MTTETIAPPLATLSRQRSTGVRRFLSSFRRQWLGMIGAALMGLVVVAAVFAPWIAPYEPGKIYPLRLLGAPGGEHFLGSDCLGRAVFRRIGYGGGVSTLSGFLVVSVSYVAG